MKENNTIITIGSEYGDNEDQYSREDDAYITQTLVSLNMVEDNLECIEIHKLKWSDWKISFNRKLSRLEEFGIMHIANADSITDISYKYLSEVENVYTYALWWD